MTSDSTVHAIKAFYPRLVLSGHWTACLSDWILTGATRHWYHLCTSTSRVRAFSIVDSSICWLRRPPKILRNWFTGGIWCTKRIFSTKWSQEIIKLVDWVKKAVTTDLINARRLRNLESTWKALSSETLNFADEWLKFKFMPACSRFLPVKVGSAVDSY